MATVKDPYGKFSLQGIGAGSRFRAGSVGWKGAMRDLKRPGRSAEFSNLSSKDVETGSRIIEDRLKHKSDQYSGFNRGDVESIRHDFEGLRRAGKLSGADAKDFMNIAKRFKGK